MVIKQQGINANHTLCKVGSPGPHVPQLQGRAVLIERPPQEKCPKRRSGGIVCIYLCS